MINEEDPIEINGKKYSYDEGYGESGPSYDEVYLEKLTYSGDTWFQVDDAPVLCGKCKGDLFKVSSCNRNYESWAYCPCGNKFTVHTG